MLFVSEQRLDPTLTTYNGSPGFQKCYKVFLSTPVSEWPLKVRFTGDDIAVGGAKARRENRGVLAWCLAKGITVASVCYFASHFVCGLGDLVSWDDVRRYRSGALNQSGSDSFALEQLRKRPGFGDCAEIDILVTYIDIADDDRTIFIPQIVGARGKSQREAAIAPGFRQEHITSNSILEMDLPASRGLSLMSQQLAAGGRRPDFHEETGHSLMRTRHGVDRSRDARKRKRKNYRPL
jgi:hypothetical protein